MEKDTLTSEFLGSIKPIQLEKFAEYEGLCEHDEIIYNSKNNKAGNIKFNT